MDPGGAAMKVINIFGSKFTGTLGKSMTAAEWNGRNYIRGYRKPHNPRTTQQVTQRDHMSDGATYWNDFEPEQKQAYDLSNAKHAGKITNFNSMMKQALNDLRAGEEYVEPFYGTTYIKNAVTGEYVPGATFTVYSQGERTYYLRYSDENGEIEGIGIVAEDQPYRVKIWKTGFVTLEIWNLTAAEVITTFGLTPE